MVFVDNRFPNYVDGIATILKNVEKSEKPEVEVSRLYEIIVMLVEKLEIVCSYGDEVRRLKSWTEKLWQIFTKAWWFLLNWTETVLDAASTPKLDGLDARCLRNFGDFTRREFLHAFTCCVRRSDK